ncbi:hypothetical protein POTOM_053896 [Populus tomentosa]|uniref:Uncharacterized protein n=1 Tax=Populus tomentosa TaxID=118781 RepID=A0A8X7Y641_POPTO|nr:hypothetical protein POTOM_053896 [Populus tomentosa]
MKSWEVYTGRRGFQNKILFVSFWPPVWKTTYLKRISRHAIIFLFPFGLFNTLLLNFTVHHGPQILQTSASSSRLTFSSKVQRPPRNAASPSSQQRSNGISGVAELASGLGISKGIHTEEETRVVLVTILLGVVMILHLLGRPVVCGITEEDQVP